MSSGAYTQFREWLIVQLQRTRWVHLKEPPERTAERLGVDVAVLQEAKSRYAKNVARGKLGHGIISESTEIMLKMPEQLHGRWIERCDDLQLESAAVFRTLVHRLLVARHNPTDGYDGWCVDGQRYTTRRTGDKAWPWRIRTLVSRGARSALKIRAERARVSESALVRGSVIQFLEGRIERFPHIYSAEQMHASTEKYWLGEKQ